MKNHVASKNIFDKFLISSENVYDKVLTEKWMSLSIFLLPLEPSSLIWMCCFDNWGEIF